MEDVDSKFHWELSAYTLTNFEVDILHFALDILDNFDKNFDFE
jgi:hypothetical protein